ncbi:hypothetical protein DYB36_006633 [Aphanomyces astaci]|uniref:RING-type domain-containing protein n=1 Tax=Aphanomyces astaci TaxID=112090 RepID=A0A397AHL2_APHAT|nr:hypothetical protein DYB36_006633 [Aphanomyces astaci]
MSYDHVDPQQNLHAMAAYGGSFQQQYDTLSLDIPSPFDPHLPHHHHHQRNQQSGNHLSPSSVHSSSMQHPHTMHSHHSQAHHQQQQSYASFQPPNNNPFASMSVKRKSPMYQDTDESSPTSYAFVHAAAASSHNPRPSPTASLRQSQPSTMSPLASSSIVCDLCKHLDPILYIPECGHTFHSRCVGEWPMVTCPTCRGSVPKVAVVHVDMHTKAAPRSGKWTKQEEKFVTLIVDEFDHGTFPLANGTPVRLVLAKLLNCSPMRLSKKFQKNALGKRTYRVPKSSHAAPNGSRICFDAATHQARQIEFSASEHAFREEVVLLQRKDNKMDGHIEVRDLRLAVVQFWVSNFLKFALSVGQQVDGLDTTEPKKKKQAMQKLRDGMFDQVLSWAAAAASDKTRTDDDDQAAGTSRQLQPPAHPPPLHLHPLVQWDEAYFKSEPLKAASSFDSLDNHENYPDQQTDYGDDEEAVPFQPHEYKQLSHLQQTPSHHHQPTHAMQRHHHHTIAPPSFGRDDGGIAYGSWYGSSYKRPTMVRDPPTSHRTALTPKVAELDGLLMSTNHTPSHLRPHQPSPATTYDAMDAIPTNSSWDQMLDDFTGINSQLVVDPALNGASWL